MRREPQHQESTTRARSDRHHSRRRRLRFHIEHEHERRRHRPSARVRAVPALARGYELSRPESRRPVAEHPAGHRHRSPRVQKRTEHLRKADAGPERSRRRVGERKSEREAARCRTMYSQSRPPELPRPHGVATATSAAGQPHGKRHRRARRLPGVSGRLPGAHPRDGRVRVSLALSPGQSRPRAISIRRPSMRSPSTRRPLCWYSFVIQVLMPRICAAVSSEKVRSTYMSST